MRGRDEQFRGWVVAVSPEAQRLTEFSEAVRAGGVEAVATARSLPALRDRIRAGCDDQLSDVVLAVVDRAAIAEADRGDRQALFALAYEAGTALAVVDDETDDGEYPETAIADDSLMAGVAVVVGAGQDTVTLGRRIARQIDVQQERRRHRSRERALEAEVASLRVMESRLHHMVYHDELTGLVNRRRLREVAEISILRAANLHRPCALVLIDIDRFKLVNDLEGYEAGDRMLVELARLLTRHARKTDTVARIGSDEFVLLLDNCVPEEALERAEHVQEALDSYRFREGQRAYRIGVSIGIATMTGDEPRPCTSELLARADQACFVAKRQGRNRVERYSDTHPELAQFRRDHGLAPLIRDAIEKDRLFFVFQPIVRVADGRITHYECLIRMHGPDGELYMPGDFIPVAERTGLIHHIDIWVVDRALDFLSQLPPGREDVSVSINLSGHAFHNRDLFDLISRRLEMSWVSPTRLVMEITETAAIENLDVCRDVVARLRALGCRFALDDFGSGFSTFHYIKHFPVDYLKIDGSFIENLARDATDQSLVRHMIAIARNLGKESIAEFVESREVYDMLARFGVDYIQGHYVGRATETPVERVDLPVPRVARGSEPRLDEALLRGLPDSG